MQSIPWVAEIQIRGKAQWPIMRSSPRVYVPLTSRNDLTFLCATYPTYAQEIAIPANYFGNAMLTCIRPKKFYAL